MNFPRQQLSSGGEGRAVAFSTDFTDHFDLVGLVANLIIPPVFSVCLVDRDAMSIYFMSISSFSKSTWKQLVWDIVISENFR